MTHPLRMEDRYRYVPPVISVKPDGDRWLVETEPGHVHSLNGVVLGRALVWFEGPNAESLARQYTSGAP